MLDREYDNENEFEDNQDEISQDAANAFGYDDGEVDEQKISAYYVHRRIKKNKLERKARQNQMWFNRFRVLLRLAVLCLMVFAGYKTLYLSQWYLNPSIFNNLDNKSLEIVNNKMVPQNKILAALRRTTIPHIPIYRLETDEIKQNILRLDPVDDVFVRRFWFPARLQIIIKEKVPVLTISPAENVLPVAFFAEDGTLIGRDYLPLSPSYKTVLVLSYGARGDDYRQWDVNKVKQIERLAKIVKNHSKESVQYIDFRNPKDVYVKINTVNIRIGLLDDTVFDRVKRISSILPQVKMLDKPIKYVDLRWKDTNYIKLAI